ncbi:MAG: benzoate-CoA ligase family protein [Betaproteobacteria bacterium]|nr:benzoate-CoA ligase family protein [Betaproteobacteria bacterium]
MPGLSRADFGTSPPRIDIPRDYNAAHDLIERNLAAGRAGKVAYIDDRGRTTFGELAARVNRFANALVELGMRPEERVLVCLLDSVDFPTAFLGSIKAGIVPVAANTLLTPTDYAYMLDDSRARTLVVSGALLPSFLPILAGMKHLKHVIVSGDGQAARPAHALDFDALLKNADDAFDAAPTTRDDVCFWLYSSGSTGAPKGTMHIHSSLVTTAYLHGGPVVGVREDDVLFSAAKLFFAYGLGNALTYTLAFGTTTILMAERPTPEAVFKRLKEHRPTIFYGVPTLFAMMMASAALPKREEVAIRLCTSAGEALPEHVGKRFSQHFGVDILDGLGSTEMLHVYLSNRPGDVRYGTSGRPVPGYRLRVVDDEGAPVADGEVGELQVNGPTSAQGYWNNREKSHATFQGPWTRSGDKYRVDTDGRYVYSGRTDDMLKVGGIYVSPIEVESALVTHEAVLEAAVVGREDADKLVKPMAYVVLKSGRTPSETLAGELREHVKLHLAPYKFPRWVEFLDELPKTATGKIQRFKLRARLP